jgi:hypothetical protein
MCPCDAERPTRALPRKTQPPTQRLPVAAAAPRTPVSGSRTSIENVKTEPPLLIFAKFI